MTTILKSINHLYTVLTTIQTSGFFTFSIWDKNVVVSTHIQEGSHSYYSVAIVVERVASPHEAKAKSFYFPDSEAISREDKFAYAIEWLWDELTQIAKPRNSNFFKRERSEIKLHIE